jgi:quinol-cytochrome oxidoreductase complex cytochrome b subunit
LGDALGITESFDPGGFQRLLLLGSDTVGPEALVRFYLLHVVLLPLVLTALLAAHVWRIRKDGGLTRPADADERLGPAPDSYPVFTQSPAKTYQLAAIVRGRSEVVNRGPEQTVPSMPHLFYAELAVTMLTVALCLALALVWDAPLKEIANPLVPENPAKAPWYFLGLQELVSFSGFMGGIGIPTIVVLGLALIPYLDRESTQTGEWFGGPGGWPLVRQAIVVGFASVLAIEAVAIRFGWLREWFPGIPQLVVTLVNPATLLTLVYGGYSVHLVRRYGSGRAGALGLFTCFLCGFFVLTVIGSYFRGPNWLFYWSPADWPRH